MNSTSLDRAVDCGPGSSGTRELSLVASPLVRSPGRGADRDARG